MRQLLREECHAFTFNEDDIGCIPSSNLHITLYDITPVKKTYVSLKTIASGSERVHTRFAKPWVDN